MPTKKGFFPGREALFLYNYNSPRVLTTDPLTSHPYEFKEEYFKMPCIRIVFIILAVFHSSLIKIMKIAGKRFPPCKDFKDKFSRVRSICLFLAGLLVYFHSEVRAQQTNPETLRWLAEYITDAFQADQHLIHGTRYYNLYPSAPGNPFFEPDEFRTGSVTINDREYTDVRLKYDICNQRLLLRYSLNNGGLADIVLIHDAIRGFSIDGKVFRKYTIPKKGEQYCQEIGTDSLKCLYFWHKELVPLNNSLDSYNQYSNQDKYSFLLRHGDLFPFKGKKSFVACFPLTQQHAVRKYIKENRIIMRNASDADMHQLIRFCHSLEADTAVKMPVNP
jgi:hypothetical protein